MKASFVIPALAFLLQASLSPRLTAAGIPDAEQLILAPLAGTSGDGGDIRLWQARARRSDARPGDLERLGWAFVAEARRSMDDGLYGLALATAEAMADRFGSTPEARFLRGHALHNLHRFAEAEGVARKLVGTRGSARDHALLGDTLLERGDLPGAVAAIQVFANRIPGLESFARVAHLRWLHGDTAGAIAAMREAIRAGDVRLTEPQAWAFARLSHLLLHSAQPTAALEAAEAALEKLSDYPPALFERGRAQLALGLRGEAVENLQTATDAHPLPEYKWWLADALALAGRMQEANRLSVEIASTSARDDPRTAALHLATHGTDTERAVRLAKEELRQRPDIHTHDALAWALFRNGRKQEAVTHAHASLRSEIKDARVLLHAGLILGASGESDASARLLDGAAALDVSLAPSERALLQAALSGPSVTSAHVP